MTIENRSIDHDMDESFRQWTIDKFHGKDIFMAYKKFYAPQDELEKSEFKKRDARKNVGPPEACRNRALKNNSKGTRCI